MKCGHRRLPHRNRPRQPAGPSQQRRPSPRATWKPARATRRGDTSPVILPAAHNRAVRDLLRAPRDLGQHQPGDPRRSNPRGTRDRPRIRRCNREHRLTRCP
jgi:hypothetical protein